MFRGLLLPAPAHAEQGDTAIAIRSFSELTRTRFDLVIVGGGIQGAWAAWDAVLRGLSVALVEKADFGAATSANNLKLIHGGLRYLKNADLLRAHESIRERTALLRVAPQLVQPLACLVPLEGRHLEKAAFWSALKLADVIGFDRNQGMDPDHTIPAGRILSRSECIDLAPFLASFRFRGGALWHDGQIRSPERLVLALVLSAADQGAVVLNYARASELVLDGGKVAGVRVTDAREAQEVIVRGRMVLDATGPWSDELLSPPGSAAKPARALGVNLVYRGHLAEVAVGLRMRTARHRDPIGGGQRFLFLAPWRDSTLIGTAYRPFAGTADRLHLTRNDLHQLLQEANEACPALRLSAERVSNFHRGLLPLKAGAERGRPDQLAQRDRLVDHARAGGPSGLVSAVGVKYTTARRLAERSLDLVVTKLGLSGRACRTASVPLPSHRVVPAIEPGNARALVAHAVDAEMAVRLTDVVLRRSELGTEQCPPHEQLTAVANAMAEHVGWGREKKEAELEAVRQVYAPLARFREVAA